ncbi:hypothetical protein [Chryseobacterium pennipullorum]|uniref:Uncharacterized protein n=1 Tax=Chryseobacterium pennipullorum TaxID=2258963 RepID=A0A3D9B7U6_9FLAO|nr:hypothetical protein [Chryseobacterium pennipullorum]REC49643.1 hypothetical protein DRF67_04035 [Chryseobacterium pennipullorum]
MKIKFLLMIGLFTGSIIYAQDSLDTRPDRARIIGFSPAKNTKNVNGMLIKYYDEIDHEIKPKKVNGVGLGCNGLGIFFPALLLVSIPSIDNWAINDIGGEPLPDKMNKINGMQLSIINMEPTITNGLEVNVSSNISAPSVTNGVAVSPLYNFHHTTNGMAISTFANVSKKCRGIQISLFNVCKDSRGIQIGFWNENEKRKFPLINWNFKNKKS